MKIQSAILFLFLFAWTLIACGNNANTESTNTTASTNTSETTTEPKAITTAVKEKPSLTANESTVDTKTETTKMEKAVEIEAETKKEMAPSKKEMAEKAKEVVRESIKKVGKPNIKTPSSEMAPVKAPKIVTPEKPVETTIPTNIPTPKVETPKVETPKVETPKEVEKPVVPAWSHQNWEQLVNKHVSATGKVNYRGFKADKAKLDAYLAELKANSIGSDWSREKKMAYWINAYNAYTVKLIVDNYPTSSITKLDGGKPWDKKWINLDGKTLSLNDIEHKILRPTYKDARIHFAVNCAAKSCPPLLNHAWTEKNLNANLEKQAKSFINQPKVNTIGADKVVLSKIFEWYGEDFGDLIGYLNKYSKTKINPSAEITFMEYDWALNE